MLWKECQSVGGSECENESEDENEDGEAIYGLGMAVAVELTVTVTVKVVEMDLLWLERKELFRHDQFSRLWYAHRNAHARC